MRNFVKTEIKFKKTTKTKTRKDLNIWNEKTTGHHTKMVLVP